MSESKHTPGPWQVHHENKVCRVIRDEQLEIIGWCDVNNEANANLMAAAPDMYEALRKISLQLEEMRPMLSDTHAYMRNEMIADIKILLRKARGEAE